MNNRNGGHSLGPLMTGQEAARLLRTDHREVVRAARRGELPTVRRGDALLIDRAELPRMLESYGDGRATP
jgi:excisionase family DNA binding protein